MRAHLPLAWLTVLLLCGCAGLPPRSASVPTTAVAHQGDTPLAAITAAAMPADGRSGFQLLPFGPNSYAARLQLARMATHSLDVQYYVLRGDHAGRALMRALRDAAARGVRVRVLLDDLYTTGEDELLLGLAAHPNVELRLFNPFASGRDGFATRLLAAAFDLGRVNRRMHNKLFVADNVAAITGGRNMADDYLMNAPGAPNFVDMDVFAAGPVVRDLSQAFDHYWNSDVVYPVQAIASSPLDAAQLRQRFETATADARLPPAIEVSGADERRPAGYPKREEMPEGIIPMLNLPYELAHGRLSPLVPARARVLYDRVSKTAGVNERGNTVSGTVLEGAVAWFKTARQRVRLVSPYFVPSQESVASMAYARKFGVRLDIVTNSLAATDEPWVYVGYSRHVKELLALGVHIYEMSPSLSVARRRNGVFGHATGALHMKSAIVDHAQVFLGSMNLDPRSALLNTELGLIIESVELARQLENIGDAGSFYELRLSPDGQDVQWVERGAQGPDIIHDTPPETSAWLRFKLMLLAPFIPEREL